MPAMRATCSFMLVTLIGWSGCGGGDDGPPPTPVTLAFTEPAAGATLTRDVLEPGAGWIAAPLAAQLAVTGDGAADDSAELAVAAASGAKIIDGGGRTYRVVTKFTIANAGHQLRAPINTGTSTDVLYDVTAGGGGTVLTKGVPVTGLTATTGNSLNYTMVVPAGSTNLTFTTSGGTGDVDMYVKFGAAPTDTVYDCRPYAGGNAETCTFATPSAGTYYVRLKAYSTFSGVSLVGNYTTGGGGGTQTYSNTTPFSITDNATINSPITVSGRTGNAPTATPVAVNITHTFIGDLKVDLIAPDGSVAEKYLGPITSADLARRIDQDKK